MIPSNSALLYGIWNCGNIGLMYTLILYPLILDLRAVLISYWVISGKSSDLRFFSLALGSEYFSGGSGIIELYDLEKKFPTSFNNLYLSVVNSPSVLSLLNWSFPRFSCFLNTLGPRCFSIISKITLCFLFLKSFFAAFRICLLIVVLVL